jgi:hypothetical protein
MTGFQYSKNGGLEGGTKSTCQYDDSKITHTVKVMNYQAKSDNRESYGAEMTDKDVAD